MLEMQGTHGSPCTLACEVYPGAGMGWGGEMGKSKAQASGKPDTPAGSLRRQVQTPYP